MALAMATKAAMAPKGPAVTATTTPANGDDSAVLTHARLYVGGLPSDATVAELQDRFGRLAQGHACAIDSIELRRGFAYLEMSGADTAAVKARLEKAYHRTKWRGGVLRVEPAKPDYAARLANEWADAKALQEQREAVAADARRRIGLEGPLPTDVPALKTAVEFSGKRKTTFADVDAVVTEPETDGEEDDEEQQQPVISSESSDEDDEEEEEQEELQHQEKQVVEEAMESEESGDGNDEDDDDHEAEADDDDDDDDGDDHQVSSSSEEEEEEVEPMVDGAVGVDDVEEFVKQVEKEEANARRIAALEEKARKKKEQEQQQQLALKIDVLGAAASNKKITFNDSGDEEDEEDGGVGAGESGQNSSRVTNWLESSDDEDETEQDNAETRFYPKDLMDESEEQPEERRSSSGAKTFDFDDSNDADEIAGEGDDEDVAKMFAVRPEFLGEKGKKLFEMQKRFGGDQRFRLDERFMEDDENEFGGTQGLVDKVEANEVLSADREVIQYFQGEDDRQDEQRFENEWMAEQDLALDVIQELFPNELDVEKIKYRLREKKRQDPIKEASWMGEMKRYDPRNVHDCREYELHVPTEKRGAREDDHDTTLTREKKEPLIGGDRFFSTSNALGDLFTRVRKNSEDGEAGEAALDGVFGFTRPVDAENDGAEPKEAAAAFKLSSLFDFNFDDNKSTDKRDIAAMGASLLEDDDMDDADDKPAWHFTQSYMKQDDDDERMATDNEDGEEGEEEEAVETTEEQKQKTRKKRSLAEFLAFGRSFVCPEAEEGDEATWTERRKKLTLDYKRKRRDALKGKKKQQQQHAHKHKQHNKRAGK